MNTLSIALVAVAAVMAAAVAMVSTSPVEAQQPPINHAAQCRSFTSYLMRVDGNTIKISPTHAARNTQPSGVDVVILDEHLNRVPGPVSVTWTYVTTSTDASLPRQQCSEIGTWVGVFTLPGNWHSVGVRWEDQGLSEVETNESYRRPAAPVNTGPPGTVHVAQPTTVEDLGIDSPRRSGHARGPGAPPRSASSTRAVCTGSAGRRTPRSARPSPRTAHRLRCEGAAGWLT